MGTPIRNLAPVVIDKICSSTLTHFPHIEAIYLYGSYGTEYQNTDSDSDIDIALLLPYNEKKTSSMDSLPLKRELTHNLNKVIDIVFLRTTNTVLQIQVLENGQCIYYGKKKNRQLFKIFSLSQYQKLNQQRFLILKDIMESKLVLQLHP